MRYAFLALVAIYLITFFGCSPEDEQKSNHKPAEISQQQTKEKAAVQEQAAEKQVVKQLDKAEKQLAQQLADQQQAAAVTPAETEEPAAMAEKKQKEALADKASARETLTEAIDQMESATRELLQFTGVLVAENRRLKEIIAAQAESPASKEKSTKEQQPDSVQPAEPIEQSAAQELKEALNKAGDSAQKLTSEMSGKAKDVIAEQSKKAKKAAIDFTEKAVNATSTALDNAKAVVNETGEAINKKLSPEKEAAE